MDVDRLHPIFAAELIGADVRHADQALVDLVEALMREHGVLCIRDQDIGDEEHLAFARRFGPLELPGVYKPDAPRRMAYGLYDASNLDIDGEIVDPESLRAKFAKGNELFHADSSFNDMPSKWSILRGVIVPPERGDTQFIDMRAVHAALPEAMKAKIAPLSARHSFMHSREKGGAPVRQDNPFSPYMTAVQPLVREAPDGRKALFVGSHAAQIVGMDEAEGAALIEELLAFAAQPRFVYSHKWRPFDMLIWDNRCTVHRGTEFDYARHKRDLRRANVNESGEERSAVPAMPSTAYAATSKETA
jgi:alpha-ketoglutarate-dependent 2,4-dichlorophenoxyacetate dioxygenase